MSAQAGRPIGRGVGVTLRLRRSVPGVAESSEMRVARLIRARRQWLGLHQDQLSLQGGPSMSTVDRLERAVPRPYSVRTYLRMEAALGWAQGTIEWIRKQDLGAVEERRLVRGPVGIGGPGENQALDEAYLSTVSDSALLAEVERRMRG